MARHPVTPVRPVDPVGPVRRVEQGSIYFRHLDQWRIMSEFQMLQRRERERRAARAQEDGEGEVFPALIKPAKRR